MPLFYIDPNVELTGDEPYFKSAYEYEVRLCKSVMGDDYSRFLRALPVDKDLPELTWREYTFRLRRVRGLYLRSMRKATPAELAEKFYEDIPDGTVF